MKQDRSHGGGAAKRAALTLIVVMRCAPRIEKRAAYVLDSLFAAVSIKLAYQRQPPAAGPWILYAPCRLPATTNPDCLAIVHVAQHWEVFNQSTEIARAHSVAGLDAVFGQCEPAFDGDNDVDFDILANAFYFLSSWSERARPDEAGHSRLCHRDSVFARLGVAQDIVDRYLRHLTVRLERLYGRVGIDWSAAPSWPGEASYAVVLSHDVDYIPTGKLDVLRQGAKSVLRHLVRQRDPGDAIRAMLGLVRAGVSGRDPYGCVPQLIEAESALGVRSSFQVAVARRHANDVNYCIEDDRVRDYLRTITDAGFDLCLHGSYLSSDSTEGYVAEADLLGQRLAKPRGSRQHYLSFDYDRLFAAQEKAGIAYDMSMGFHDHTGPRAGFSYPYFPYCVAEDRPYNVLQISLFLMDVTLQGYMRLKPAPAWNVIEATLDDLGSKGGCASVVWHPIVFGGARDPGYDDLYWRLVDHVQKTGGLATDGRTIDAFWRQRCSDYDSFAGLGPSSESIATAAASQGSRSWQMC
jgi:hypothetical protein